MQVDQNIQVRSDCNDDDGEKLNQVKNSKFQVRKKNFKRIKTEHIAADRKKFDSGSRRQLT